MRKIMSLIEARSTYKRPDGKIGLSQHELKLKAGVSQKTINDIENGYRTPYTSTKFKIASALDLDISDIIWS